MESQTQTRYRKPPWLKRSLPTGPGYEKVRQLLKKGKLHTVCQEAKCPNMWECFSNGTATFLIMGPECTRNCRFCNVTHASPVALDPAEPRRVAEAVALMELNYVVITSVTRDDLPDGGATHFAATIGAVHEVCPKTRVEVLIPDLQGDARALQTILAAGPDILNHNIETVPRLYTSVRPQADYGQSLELLRRVSADGRIPAKSGLMLGLGETAVELRHTLADLLTVGCRVLTLGQYLQPSAAHLPVARFVPPQEFRQWRLDALGMGFHQVASGPFVRSSYHARELFQATEPS